MPSLVQSKQPEEEIYEPERNVSEIEIEGKFRFLERIVNQDFVALLSSIKCHKFPKLL